MVAGDSKLFWSPTNDGAPRGVAAGDPGADSRNAGVLIVDVDSSECDGLQRVLRFFGFDVWHAADGNEAMSLCRRHQATMRVALLDWQLPNGDGLSIWAAIHHQNRGLRYCLMGDRFGPFRGEELRQFAIEAVFAKPIAPLEVVCVLKRLLAPPPCLPSPRARELQPCLSY